MNVKTLGLIAVVTVLSTPISASDYKKIYTQPMEGVYSQGWFADHLQEVSTGRHEIYVRGDGKMGDFFGVLWLDCVEAQYSNWLSVGGFLSEDDVPIEAIKALRQTYC